MCNKFALKILGRKTADCRSERNIKIKCSIFICEKISSTQLSL